MYVTWVVSKELKIRSREAYARGNAADGMRELRRTTDEIMSESLRAILVAAGFHATINDDIVPYVIQVTLLDPDVIT
ncbi:hypothetical protein Ate02nite_64200 [Paractinoplanes tereljensis]|uniref:Uncharacterized protein n=1 Tax=Paractinoplanes tereljensis TaxID=571912 RepID=A0A919TWX4_9ACTN|nr:hypothetical protein Ate02nite_64200 [Actinoplanes tereljensis]